MMANIVTESSTGLRRVEVAVTVGTRRQVVKLRLGRCSQRRADEVKVLVQSLEENQRFSRPHDPDQLKDVAKLPGRVQQKLERCGLISATGLRASDLESFLKEVFASMSVKPSTMTIYSHTRRNLVDCYGASTDIRTIDSRAADRFRSFLVDEKLAAATINRRIIAARQFFKYAVKWQMIMANPFADVRGGQQKNKARLCFITVEMIDKLLDACPSQDWRLIVLLARYGAVRVPSEIAFLTWDRLDFENREMRIHAPKTEHHPGHDERRVPMFPQLYVPLLEAFTSAPAGSKYVIADDRFRQPKVNLRTEMTRIMKRAGVEWVKPFQNLRSTRETELASHFPAHLVREWVGHGKDVAEDHYLQVRQSDCKRAAMIDTNAARNAALPASENGRKAVQVDEISNAGEARKSYARDALQEKDSGLPQLAESSSGRGRIRTGTAWAFSD